MFAGTEPVASRGRCPRGLDSRVPKDQGLSLHTRFRPSPEPEPAVLAVTDSQQTEPGPDAAPPRRGRVRRARAAVATTLAAVLVFAALVAPDQHTRLTLDAFI